MSLSVVAAVKAKRRAKNAIRTFATSTALDVLLDTLFSQLAQNGNPDLLIVEAVANSTTDAVVAAEACKLYGVFLKGGATARAVNWADHASSANSPTTIIPVGVAEQVAYIWPAGAAYANGITFDEAGTGGASGFFIIGNP